MKFARYSECLIPNEYAGALRWVSSYNMEFEGGKCVTLSQQNNEILDCSSFLWHNYYTKLTLSGLWAPGPGFLQLSPGKGHRSCRLYTGLLWLNTCESTTVYVPGPGVWTWYNKDSTNLSPSVLHLSGVLVKTANLWSPCHGICWGRPFAHYTWAHQSGKCVGTGWWVVSTGSQQWQIRFETKRVGRCTWLFQRAHLLCLIGSWEWICNFSQC